MAKAYTVWVDIEEFDLDEDGNEVDSRVRHDVLSFARTRDFDHLDDAIEFAEQLHRMGGGI